MGLRQTAAAAAARLRAPSPGRMLRAGAISGALLALLLLAGSCAGGGSGVVREYRLTAEVVDWTVVEGEVVEVWGYNGQYPGPTIEADVGDTVRINFTNNLPEPTTIHWHGLDVPNDQDGVPGITQAAIEPGESFIYEFQVDRAGTSFYHTHYNTVYQLARGLVGPIVVHDRGREVQYDGDYTFVLHEIDGLFTINGHSFPATLENDDTFIKIEQGDRIRIRFINAGSLYHPMHLHGHQFWVIARDGHALKQRYQANTVSVAPGETVDIEIDGTNPGTWVLHCHVLPHVTNRGVYPGGMLTVLDYTDHESYFDQQLALPPTALDGAAAAAASAIPDDVVAPTNGVLEIVASEFSLRPGALLLPPGEEITLRLRNDGVLPHNIQIPQLGVFIEANGGSTAELTFRVPEGSTGFVEFLCNIQGHRELGMWGKAFFSGD